MRVGLDLYGSRTPGTGGDVYVRGLLRGLSAVDPLNTYALFGNPMAGRFPGNFRYLGCSESGPVDAWHFPEASSPHLEGFVRGGLPLRFRKGTCGDRGLPVASVHDVIFDLRPEEFSRQTRSRLAGNIRGAMAAGAVFLVPSNWSRETLGEHFAIPGERIRVIPLAADAAFRPGKGQGLPRQLAAAHRITGPYILFVGSPYPRKNLAGALRAFALLGTGHQLVATGVPPRHGMRLAAEILPRGCEHRLRFPGVVARAHLVEIYRSADVVLYPSFAEGFGLPVLEAMASGVPVVAADIPPVREVAGGAALLVDPSSAESMAEGLDRAVSDPSLRLRMIDGGVARARAFSWEATARLTVAAYASVS